MTDFMPLATISVILYPLVVVGTAIGVVFMALKYTISNEQREIITNLKIKYDLLKEDKEKLDQKMVELQTSLDYHREKNNHFIDKLS